MNNLAYDPSFKDIKIKLKEELYAWMKNSEDPILNGRIKDLRGNPATHY